MSKFVFFIFLILCLTSCENNGKYSGRFRSPNKNAFGREVVIRYLHDNKYEINFLGGLIKYDGKRKGNRITANYVEDPNMVAAYGQSVDQTNLFFDYNSDANKITVTSDNMNNLETYIRIR